MTPWATARHAAEQARQDLWGTTVTYKTDTVTCEATSTEYSKEQQRTSMFPKKPDTISIFREDYLRWVGMGLLPNETVSSEGESYRVNSITDDAADATVDLRCTLLV